MSELVSYSAAVVTFRRPDSLKGVLDALGAQSHPPGLVVVADCDPGETGREPVLDFSDGAPFPVLYEPLGANLGPAGGWAAAVELAQRHQDRGEWIGVFDDDDPLTDDDVMALLCAQAAGYRGDPDAAAVGLRGATMSRSRARLNRVLDPRQSADYLASNGAPLYRWEVLDRVGFFDPEFFFGFEDLDLGLRMRDAGATLHVLAAETEQVVEDTSPTRVPWREYYKTRALTAICRRHLGPVALAALLTRSVVAGSLRLVVEYRSIDLAIARFRGAQDGLLGRMGVRRYHPSENPTKPGRARSVT